MINITSPSIGIVSAGTTSSNLYWIAIVCILCVLIFAVSIWYTIYKKTREGFYDENNNEIINPIERAIR
jgi:hypothetical protein